MVRYDTDPLANPAPKKHLPEVPVEPGMVLEDVETGWVGAVVRVEKSGGIHVVQLEDRHGKVRGFPLGPGFWLDGQPIVATPPKVQADGGLKLTASGSIAAPTSRAKVARASRIWVEGRHDAELVERIWGDDLREVAVVVELLDGVDNLAEVLNDFQPTPRRRAGVLVDHFVPGSKETRLVEEALRGVDRSNVLVLGHPYIDVWQAVKPARLGLDSWPQIPRSIDIKKGTLAALGWAHADQADIAMGWKRILGRVRDYRDLEPALLGRMEELIDFVTAIE
ncbi:Protein of unknown function [Ruaniaceae bacterium KH17]|nr:Protein of unknown function [Ruaniaceae bacterium KH17]